MQTRKQSLLEVIIDALIGMVISVISYLIIFPMLGAKCSVVQSFWMTGYFVCISMLRRYFTRRFFNQLKSRSDS